MAKTEKEKMAKIRVVLTEDNILQDYAPVEDFVLNPALEEYIIGETRKAKAGSDYVLEVKASDEQKAKFSKALINSFEQKIKLTEREIKKSLILAIIMAVMGAAILSLSYIFKDNRFLCEIFLVASWVFLWRAVELFIFERQQKTVQIYKYIKLISAEIKSV